MPGQTEGNVINRVVSTVDIYPSIIGLSGIDMPHKTDGKSLVQFLKNPLSEWEDTAYGYYRNGISLRTGRYRLTKYFREEEPVIELYDHNNDSNETKNVADDNPDIIENLMPLWGKGNTGLFD